MLTSQLKTQEADLSLPQEKKKGGPRIITMAVK